MCVTCRTIIDKNTSGVTKIFSLAMALTYSVHTPILCCFVKSRLILINTWLCMLGRRSFILGIGGVHVNFTQRSVRPTVSLLIEVF